MTPDNNNLFQAMMAELQKAAPEISRKRQEEASRRAAIERRVQDCQNAIQERRQEMTAQRQEAEKSAKERCQRQHDALQAAIKSGSTEELASALAAMDGEP